jgi:hypothetical protein
MALIGKVCPYCGRPGEILYTTKERIVYQCSNDHQYETESANSLFLHRNPPPRVGMIPFNCEAPAY